MVRRDTLIQCDAKAAERLHDFLRTLQNGGLSTEQTTTRLTHTNSSPTIPGWFIMKIRYVFQTLWV